MEVEDTVRGSSEVEVDEEVEEVVDNAMQQGGLGRVISLAMMVGWLAGWARETYHE